MVGSGINIVDEVVDKRVQRRIAPEKAETRRIMRLTRSFKLC